MVETVAVADGDCGPGVASGRPAPSGSEPSAAPDHLRLVTVLALLAIVAGALLLRFHNLEQWGMWDDELYTVQHTAEMVAGHVDWRFLAWLTPLIGFELAGVDMSSLAAEEYWTWRAAGVTEWTVRAPMALLGALNILVLGLIGQRTLGSRPTLWLCLLLALSPWHLWMSQVGRFYVQLFLLYNMALLLYYQATDEGHLGRAVAAMVCVVLAFYTTPISMMILGVFGIDVVSSWLRRRPSGMRPAFWAIGVAALALCAIGVLSRFSSQPEQYDEFVGSPQSIPMMTLGMVYLVGMPMVVMAALGLRALAQRDERLAILLAAAAVVPLAAFAVFNLLGKDTHVRYMFVALFAWLALAAIGIELIIASLRPRVGILAAGLPAVALISAFVLSDYVDMNGGAGYRPPWREATAYIEAHRRPGELVGGDWAARRMAWYYLEEPDAVLLPHGFSERDMLELVPRPAWILLGAHRPSQPDRFEQLKPAGALQAYFTNRISEPYYAVNVYHYTPPPAAEPTADRS